MKSTKNLEKALKKKNEEQQNLVAQYNQMQKMLQDLASQILIKNGEVKAIKELIKGDNNHA